MTAFMLLMYIIPYFSCYNGIATPIDIEKEIKIEMKNSEIPSLALAVVRDGEIVYSNGFGFYDDEQTKAANENTLYLASSISKLVVSVAVMQQVELGNVDLDADISKYLGFLVRNPKYPESIITPRLLMQHGSSLSNPGYGETVDEFFIGYDPDSTIALHPLIEEILTEGHDNYRTGIWQNYRPGTIHKNSNLGMTLLGYMVEKITGEHFNDYSKKHILNPIGMESSSYFYPDLNENNVADLYSGPNGDLLEPFTLFYYPAGMLRTSIKDWSKFILTILNGGTINDVQILQANSVQTIMNVSEPQGNRLAYNSKIGLIWRQAYGSQGWIGHTGAGAGVTHVTEINRDRNIGYVIFTNKERSRNISPGGNLYKLVHKWLN
jgi:CubicO group peptidase (beta-lactamase class C family)